MKSRFSAVAMLALLSIPASATTLVCKSANKATGQGYEASFEKGKAIVSLEGRQEAILRLTKETIARHPDGETVRVFDQSVVNGYRVKLVSGGLIGRSRATVYRGGDAGYIPVAELMDCR